MTTDRRLYLVVGVLLLGAAGHWALVGHLGSSGLPSYPELLTTLETFPSELNPTTSASPPWVGSEHPGRESVARQVPWNNGLLYRVYRSEAGPFALLYAAYSRTGEDRKHHPEICIREVTGAPEDLDARKVVPLGPEGQGGAQRYRFRVEGGRPLTLYYWHYTLPALASPDQSWLQRAHRFMLVSPPSVTFQLTTYATGDGLDRVEAELLPAIATAMTAVVPPGTRVGHDRIPVTYIRR